MTPPTRYHYFFFRAEPDIPRRASTQTKQDENVKPDALSSSDCPCVCEWVYARMWVCAHRQLLQPLPDAGSGIGCPNGKGLKKEELVLFPVVLHGRDVFSENLRTKIESIARAVVRCFRKHTRFSNHQFSLVFSTRTETPNFTNSFKSIDLSWWRPLSVPVT